RRRRVALADRDLGDRADLRHAEGVAGVVALQRDAVEDAAALIVYRQHAAAQARVVGGKAVAVVVELQHVAGGEAGDALVQRRGLIEQQRRTGREGDRLGDLERALTRLSLLAAKNWPSS